MSKVQLQGLFAVIFGMAALLVSLSAIIGAEKPDELPA